jgi:DNA-binding transcriptional ArsR family regulator
MAGYFEVALAGDWARLRALAEADVRYRSARIADHGAIAVLADLHAEVRWYGGRVSTAVRGDDLGRLAGRPAVLTPTAFAWPNASSSSGLTGGWRLCYPPRAVGTLWSAAPATPAPALEVLLGATRAAVLQALGTPRTTGGLARLLGIAAATASHHLAALRNAGLLTSDRHGRHTVHTRTPLGDRMAEAGQPADPSHRWS